MKFKELIRNRWGWITSIIMTGAFLMSMRCFITPGACSDVDTVFLQGMLAFLYTPIVYIGRVLDISWAWILIAVFIFAFISGLIFQAIWNTIRGRR